MPHTDGHTDKIERLLQHVTRITHNLSVPLSVVKARIIRRRDRISPSFGPVPISICHNMANNLSLQVIYPYPR